MADENEVVVEEEVKGEVVKAKEETETPAEEVTE